MVGKKVESHVLEKIITILMVIFGFVAVFIFASAFRSGMDKAELAIIEILLIIVLGILAQTVILIRIYDHASK
jgi:hypothetical protein